MTKDKLFKKLGNAAKDKASELANKYTHKAKDKATDLMAELADEAAEKTGDFVRESIGRGTKQFISKPAKASGEKLQNADDIRSSKQETDYEKKQPEIQKVKDSMTDEEDDKFIDGISTEMAQTGLKGILSPSDALAVVDNIVQIAGEVEKFREVQKTKRAAIEAEKQVVITRLNAQKKLLIKYLDETFDERKENFKKLFDVIDDALAKENIQQLAMGLSSVTELAKSSPFKDLADIEQVGKALEDKNHEWDF
jgi:hypothetical protein